MPPTVFRAQVIRMQDFPRTSRHEWEEDLRLQGFRKGMELVLRLERCTPAERRFAIENWVACEGLTAAERDAAYAAYGWERAP